MNDDKLIWWLKQDELERAEFYWYHRVALFPSYIRVEFDSMMGRPLRGRLWVNSELGVAREHEVKYELFSTDFGSTLTEAGGLVIKREHADLVQRLPGVVTDFELNKV